MAELGAVDGGEETELAGVLAAAEQTEARRLRERLHEDHARKHRMAREVAAEDVELGVDVELGDAVLVERALEDARDPDERLAMREDLLDLVQTAREGELGHGQSFLKTKNGAPQGSGRRRRSL